MSLALKFGAEVLGAATTLRIQQTGEAPDVRESWRVELQVEAATPAALETTLQSLRDAQGTTDDVKLVAGMTDVRTLEVADCRTGPVLTTIDESDASPGEAHNRRRVVLTFDATLQDAAVAVQSNTLTLVVRNEAGKPGVLHHSGKAILRRGETPADHEASVLPPLAAGYRRVKRLVTRDASEPSVVYEIEDEQVFAALPGGVEDGHYVVTDSQDADGRVVRTISGFFAGAYAKARALELRPGDALLEARVSEDPFTRRVDFEFREAVADRDAIARAESLTFTTTRRVIDHALLDTSLPAYRQQIGAPQTEVIQEGSAVGHGRHPSPPAVRFNADLIERKVHYSVPHPALPADRRWVTNWRYVSRTRAAAIESTP